MQYARDLVSLEDDDADGEQWLRAGTTLYPETSTVTSIPRTGETIAINP